MPFGFHHLAPKKRKWNTLFELFLPISCSCRSFAYQLYELLWRTEDCIWRLFSLWLSGIVSFLIPEWIPGLAVEFPSLAPPDNMFTSLRPLLSPEAILRIHTDTDVEMAGQIKEDHSGRVVRVLALVAKLWTSIWRLKIVRDGGKNYMREAQV